MAAPAGRELRTAEGPLPGDRSVTSRGVGLCAGSALRRAAERGRSWALASAAPTVRGWPRRRWELSPRAPEAASRLCFPAPPQVPSVW